MIFDPDLNQKPYSADIGRVSFLSTLPLSSVVEQLTVNQRVVGSNPTAAATTLNLKPPIEAVFLYLISSQVCN